MAVTLASELVTCSHICLIRLSSVLVKDPTSLKFSGCGVDVTEEKIIKFFKKILACCFVRKQGGKVILQLETKAIFKRLKLARGK